MKAWFQKSFRNRLFATVLLTALVPLILCDVLLMQLQVSRTERIQQEQAVTELNVLTGRFSGNWEKLEAVVTDLAGSTIVRSALRRGGTDSRVAYQLLHQKTQGMSSYADFEIIDAEGNCVYTTATVLPEQQRNPHWGVLHRASEQSGVAVGSGGNDTLGAYCAVRSAGGSILGYVGFSIGQAQFDRLFSYEGTGDLLLVDGTWNAVYGTRPGDADDLSKALKARLAAGKPFNQKSDLYRYFTAPFGDYELILVLLQPKAFTAGVLRTIYTLAFLMGLLCFLLCLLCAWILSRHLTDPISRLNSAMGQVEQGNYDVRIRNERRDELGTLSDAFNRMTQKYHSNLESSVQRQRELNETQIRMMQAQLNPHFLYNTLDSMKWMGLTHGAPEIASLATDLASILRTSISQEELIPLEQELDLIDRYLDIQYIRFQDSFACEIEVAEQFQHCMVPKMTLQPLVENAIVHGVADMEEGYIKLWAEQDGTDLLLHVRDNGAGIPADVLERLNSPDKQIPGGHLGLYNADKIIGLHFGPGYGLTAESTPGKGSTVTLRLPMI